MGRLLSRVTRPRTQAQIQHLTPVAPDQAQGPVRRVFAQVEQDFGLLAPPISLHAAAPGPLAAAWLMLRETLVATGRVRRAVKEAVAVTVSAANACPYCVDVHGIALHGLLPAHQAAAVTGGRADRLDAELARAVSWVRAAGEVSSRRPDRVAAGHRPELIGTAVTFHYLNRMVNIFLVPSPIPAGVPQRPRQAIARVAGRLMRSGLRRPAPPGASLGLLPARRLPGDLAWTAGNPAVAEAFARAAGSITAAGERSVPAAVRALVEAELAAWDGRPPGVSTSWVEQRLSGLPPELWPVGRLALLTALASYQVGPTVVAAYRRWRPDDRSLIEVTSWASLAAARWWGSRLHQ